MQIQNNDGSYELPEVYDEEKMLSAVSDGASVEVFEGTEENIKERIENVVKTEEEKTKPMKCISYSPLFNKKKYRKIVNSKRKQFQHQRRGI